MRDLATLLSAGNIDLFARWLLLRDGRQLFHLLMLSRVKPDLFINECAGHIWCHGIPHLFCGAHSWLGLLAKSGMQMIQLEGGLSKWNFLAGSTVQLINPQVEMPSLKYGFL